MVLYFNGPPSLAFKRWLMASTPVTDSKENKLFKLLLTPSKQAGGAVRRYPPREFPNVPSLEESRDIWRAELAKRLPLRTCWALLAVFVLGVLSAAWKIPLVALQDAGYALSSMLLGFPGVYLVWVLAQLPPWPTAKMHAKTVEFMRVYRKFKADAVERVV